MQNKISVHPSSSNGSLTSSPMKPHPAPHHKASPQSERGSPFSYLFPEPSAGTSYPPRAWLSSSASPSCPGAPSTSLQGITPFLFSVLGQRRPGQVLLLCRGNPGRLPGKKTRGSLPILEHCVPTTQLSSMPSCLQQEKIPHGMLSSPSGAHPSKPGGVHIIP